MRYFLDGYNFLFRISPGLIELKRSRDLFLQVLAIKNREKELDITVFFDANREEPYLAHSALENIHILFCSSYKTADEAILHEVECSKNPKEITVVTNDKPLATASRHIGASTMSPSAFLVFLGKMKRKKTKAERESKELKAPLTPRFSSLSDYYLHHFRQEDQEGKLQEGVILKKEKLHRESDAIESEFLRWLRLFSEEEAGK